MLVWDCPETVKRGSGSALRIETGGVLRNGGLEFVLTGGPCSMRHIRGIDFAGGAIGTPSGA